MMRKLPLAACVLALLVPAARVAAQVVNPTATLSAPGMLACNAIDTATLELHGIASAPMELMLVVDEGSGLWDVEFYYLQRFVAALLDRLIVGPGFARVGIVQSSINARLVLGLTENRAEVTDAINGTVPLDGNTCIGCGVALADQQLQAGARPGARRYMVVLTDGLNVVDQSTFASVVDTAKANGTTIVAVGRNLSDTDLLTLASPGAGFPIGDFTFLDLYIDDIVLAAAFPALASTDAQIDLTVSPEFAVLGASTDTTGRSVTVSGNAVTWTIDRPGQVDLLSISLQRLLPVVGSAPLFASATYHDREGRSFPLPNATIDLPECGSGTDAEIAALQAEIDSLTEQLASLQQENAALTAETESLSQQVLDLQAENTALSAQIALLQAPAGTMYGIGQIASGTGQSIFMLSARKAIDGTMKAALQFAECDGVNGEIASDLRCLVPLHKFVLSQFTSIAFTNDPAFAPSANPEKANMVDTVHVIGTGTWDGIAGYHVDLTATDRGDSEGPNTDTFQIVISTPDGVTVLSATGSLVVGNLESYAY